MNRRDFVITGITTAGTAAIALTATMTHGSRSPFAAIFDRRFEAARAFAGAMAWRGHSIYGFDGDITALWLREIEPQWRRRAGALAGVSTPTALFCLEQLAAQHWLRVVTRTALRAGTSGPLTSWVIA